MQSRRGSFIEAIVNVLVGFGLATLANMLVIPVLGYDITLNDSMGIAFVLTFVSIARSYTLRRIFNWFILRRSQQCL